MKNYHSLRNNREFQMVYNEGNSKANRYLVLYYRKNDLKYNRLGISVSKKVGNSVVRHRTTRLIRESYRLNQDNLKTGYDMVVIARQTAKGQNYHTIESAFLHLIDLHHLQAVQMNGNRQQYQKSHQCTEPQSGIHQQINADRKEGYADDVQCHNQ